MAAHAPVLETFLDVGELRRGKVRDNYDLGDKLLLVASDRISAFDVILPNGIPDKGRILTRMAEFWLRRLSHIVPNHLLTTNVDQFPDPLRRHTRLLQGRSMLVRKAEVIPIECVVRGYLAGSGWKDYQAGRDIGGHRLPAGMKQSQKLAEPLFSPATKEASGHDINISFDDVVDRIGRDLAEKLRDTALALYHAALEIAEPRGVIIADTKFEFGLHDGDLMLVDEMLTPDSSRFWRKSEYREGRPQNPFDKQLVRDYLETLDWDKTYPGPLLPADIVDQTRQRYIEAYEMLTGMKFEY